MPHYPNTTAGRWLGPIALILPLLLGVGCERKQKQTRGPQTNSMAPMGMPSMAQEKPTPPSGSPPATNAPMALDPAASLMRNLAGGGSGPPAGLTLPDAAGVTRLDAARAAKAPLVHADVKRIVALARTRCREHWFGLYLGQAKIGHAMLGCKVHRVPIGGRQQEVYETYALFKMIAVVYKKRVKNVIHARTRFATTGAGALLFHEVDNKGMLQTSTITVTKRGATWTLSRTYRGGAVVKPKEVRTLAKVRTTLANSEAAFFTLLVDGRIKPGQARRMLEFDHQLMSDEESAMQLLAVGQRHLRGVPVRLFKIEGLNLKRRMRTVSVFDKSGNWLDGTVLGTIRVRREEKRHAVKPGQMGSDFGLGVVIKAPLGVPPRQVDKLRLRLRGFIPAALRQAKRHRIHKAQPKAVELTITRESLAGLKPVGLPVRDPKLARALRAEPDIEAKHPDLVKLARRVIGPAKDALGAARRLNAFVYRYLRKSLSTHLESALAIQRAREGDCTEHARLMVALCRAVGIPARELGGVTYVPSLGGFGYHAWVQVWVGRWIAVDPSWNEFPANATHIQMGSAVDYQWVGTLGTVEIDVLATTPSTGSGAIPHQPAKGPGAMGQP